MDGRQVTFRLEIGLAIQSDDQFGPVDPQAALISAGSPCPLYRYCSAQSRVQPASS